MLKKLTANSNRKWAIAHFLIFSIVSLNSCAQTQPVNKASNLEGDYSDIIIDNIEWFLNGTEYQTQIFMTEENALELYSGPPEKSSSLMDKILIEKGRENDKVEEIAVVSFENQTDLIDFVHSNINRNTIYKLSREKSFKLVTYQIK